MIRIAAAQYPLDPLARMADYEAKMARWTEEAARAGAQLLVFPEYGGMELAHLAGPAVASDLKRSIEAMQTALPEADAILAGFARRHGVHILGPSAPVRDASGRYHNTARLYAPSGASAAQRKAVMTRFEDEEWGVSPDAAQAVFDTALGRIGVAICYDVEFPLLVRRLTAAGADIILAPSCTDALAGYWRVRVGAQARALENQCVVIQAPTVGAAAWSPAVDVNVGAAGAFGPPDRFFPADGVIALGGMDKPGWVFADIDATAIARVRAEGAVLNHARWDLQPGAAPLAPAAVQALA